MGTVRCSGRQGGVSQHAWGRGVSAQGVSARGSAHRGVFPSGVCPGGCLPRAKSAQADMSGRHPSPPHEQNDWQTSVKILPCHNFVADGNNQWQAVYFRKTKPSLLLNQVILNFVAKCFRISSAYEYFLIIIFFSFKCHP